MQVYLPRWAEFIASQPESHILQDGKWGQLKSAFGWKTARIISENAGAQILFRKLPLGYSIAYIPKGPIGISESLLLEIDRICRNEKAIFIKIEPFAWEPDNSWKMLENSGYQFSTPIQPSRTVIIPLDGSEEQILAEMKQKTRYNIRLAEKKEITVSVSDDYEGFHKMSLVTGERDNFGIHSLDYYLKIKDLFGKSGQSVLLLAYYNQKPVAGIIIFACGKNAWYMYGASTDEERNRMPTYLLQWEAIKWARSKGCSAYDLWGIPDHDEEQLEKLFAEKDQHDGLWGVYRFKRGFGGTIRRSVGAWDKVYLPGFYKLYEAYSSLRKRGME
jgi:peptidoglycan pentaglycine glycine transferase (the first glycine)